MAKYNVASEEGRNFVLAQTGTAPDLGAQVELRLDENTALAVVCAGWLEVPEAKPPAKPSTATNS